MQKYLVVLPALLLVPASSIADDASGNDWTDNFPIGEYTMVADGNNRYWSLKPGRFVVLGELTPGGSEFVRISVLDETESIDGIEARIIEEREFEDGELVEVSRNFFAMAKETRDVFYFGEDVANYDDGKVVGHGGEWRAGQDGARAGLYMPGKPDVGMKYYMEYHPGVAMDRAEIYQTDATVETPGGSFSGVLIVTESSPIEPDDESYKRYAPDVGMIFDDGLELYKRGRRYPSEEMIEFEIAEEAMPDVPTGIVSELHPTGVIREVKVEIHPDRVQYAVETLIDGKQWDVEVTDTGKVYRNTPD
jgi:hypothetical protein